MLPFNVPSLAFIAAMSLPVSPYGRRGVEKAMRLVGDAGDLLENKAWDDLDWKCERIREGASPPPRCRASDVVPWTVQQASQALTALDAVRRGHPEYPDVSWYEHQSPTQAWLRCSLWDIRLMIVIQLAYAGVSEDITEEDVHVVGMSR